MAEHAHFDVEGLTFRHTRANKLSQPEWRDIQELERKAFSAALDRPQIDIDHLLDWYSPQKYSEDRTVPMKAIGRGRLQSNQLITKPRAVLAYDGQKPIGYLGHAKNTSNTYTETDLELRLKMWSGNGRYVWMREIAVHPDYQHRGIALTMGYLALEKAGSDDVSAYVWEENQAMVDNAGRLGFDITDTTSGEYPFGAGARAATVLRMQAPATGIRERIMAIPGAPGAIKYATQHAA